MPGMKTTGSSGTRIQVPALWPMSLSDLSDAAGNAASLPWQEKDCVHAYDWAVMPFYAEILLEPGTLTDANVKNWRLPLCWPPTTDFILTKAPGLFVRGLLLYSTMQRIMKLWEFTLLVNFTALTPR